MSLSDVALAVSLIAGMTIVALVGVSAYIDYQRNRASTPIEVEAEP